MSTEHEIEVEKQARECWIPDYMIGGLVRYVVHHIEPGDFLCAVIANDLLGAYQCADRTNSDKLYNYVQFFYRHAPPQCWGSREALKAWLAKREEH